MSKKLILATEYCELRRIFDGHDFKESIFTPEKIAKSFKIEDLQDKIAAVKNAIAERVNRIKIETYYSTTEGIVYRANKTAARNNCLAAINNIRQTFNNWIINEIQSEYGSLWTSNVASTFSGFDIEIGIKNQDPSRTGFTFHFGLSFTIHFDSYNYGSSTPTFKMNYGTLGAFDLLEDRNRKLYLYGMGCMAYDTSFLKELKNKCIEYNKQIAAYEQLIFQIDEEIKNPFA